MTRAILGSGWKFPLRINGRGGFSLSREEQDVAEAIWIILSTRRGERIMRPEFGCGVQDYVFAPNNAGTRGSIAYQVQQALILWEPRIDVIDVRAADDPGQPNLVLISIDYRIRLNNAFHNLVYPFFLLEGQEQQ
jgi:phage baseplate assembly protein W